MGRSGTEKEMTKIILFALFLAPGVALADHCYFYKQMDKASLSEGRDKIEHHVETEKDLQHRDEWVAQLAWIEELLLAIEECEK